MKLLKRIGKIISGNSIADRKKQIKNLEQKRILEEEKTALFERAQAEKKRIAVAKEKRGANVNLGGIFNSGGGKMVGGFLGNAGQVSLLGNSMDNGKGRRKRKSEFDGGFGMRRY